MTGSRRNKANVLTVSICLFEESGLVHLFIYSTGITENTEALKFDGELDMMSYYDASCLFLF